MLPKTLIHCCLILAASLPISSALAINKCTDPATGKVTYSDVPCPGATEKEAVELHNVEAPSGAAAAAERNGPGLSTDEQMRLYAIEREERKQEYRRNLDAKIARKQSEVQDDFDKIDAKYNQDMCDIHTKQYNQYRSKARGGYSASEAANIRQQQAEASAKMSEYCK